jgi:ribosomal protein S12 methylthiotransferase accessory factor
MTSPAILQAKHGRRGHAFVSKRILGARRLRIETLPQLLDDQVGVVQSLRDLPIDAGEPSFFRFVAKACNTLGFVNQENFGSTGGASLDRDVAMAKAVGEAVERYCAAIYDMEELPLFSYATAPVPCVAPGEFALYAPEQYGSADFMFAPFEAGTQIRWTPARKLPTGDVCHVPAAMVYVPYTYYTATNDGPIIQPISTGLASHMSRDAATVSAICEVIERDAFTIVWQARMGPPQIRRDSLSDEPRAALEAMESIARSVTLFDITLDIQVPTVLAVQRSRDRACPAIAVAASTGLDPQEAALKALEELAHTYFYAAELLRMIPEEKWPRRPEDIVVQDHHLLYWADHRHADDIEFLFRSTASVAIDRDRAIPSDSGGQLAELVQRVGAAGYAVLTTEVTSADVAELGFSVVRAIIPGLHPLQIGHRYRALGGRRLWEVPQRLGYQGIQRETGDNPAPHPYP